MAASDMMNLFKQLQNLESSFLSILFESALRLDQTLDANVFLLVETSEGRRIAGSEDLCRRFVDDALTHQHGDKRVRLQNGVQTTVEEVAKPQVFRAEDVQIQAFGSVPTSLPSSSSEASRKRQILTDNNPFEPKKIRGESSLAIQAWSSESFSEGGSGDDSQDSFSNHNFSMNFDEITIEDEDLSGHENGGPGPPVNGANRPRVSANFRPNSNASDPENFVHDFLASSAKVSALLSRTASDIQLDKTSPDVKLMTSLMYEMGKMAAGHAPVLNISDPTSRNLLRYCFETFWVYVPWLHEVQQTGEKFKSGKTLRQYLREQMYLSLRQFIGQRAKWVEGQF